MDLIWHKNKLNAEVRWDKVESFAIVNQWTGFTVQQAQAGWWEAVMRLIEASLMGQEENWSTRANTHNSLPPGYRVPFTPQLKVCVCAWLRLHVCEFVRVVGWVSGAITSCAPQSCRIVVFKRKASVGDFKTTHVIDEGSCCEKSFYSHNRLLRYIFLQCHI